MSDSQQPEEMRPIPDGGLKDAMPSWLKRPPAWRALPTADERHERALPPVETSEINPASLVDVDDLPQWLKTIASREIAPTPEPAVEHAVEVVQRAQTPADLPLIEVEVEVAAADVVVESPAPDEVAITPPELTPEPARAGTQLFWSVIILLVLVILVLALMQVL